MKQQRSQKAHQILGRLKRAEFVGRANDLERVISHATQSGRTGQLHGLLLMVAPRAGVSELLRQAFDDLFIRRENVVPIYFSLPQAETTAVSAAIEFLNTFLLQYVAYRRNEPSLCKASHTLNDLVELAPAADLDWIEELVEAYDRQRFGEDDRELVRFCLSAPQRVPASLARPFVMIDAQQLANYADSPLPFARELIRALKLGSRPFLLAGLRRELVNVWECAGADVRFCDLMRLEQLSDEDARELLSVAAGRLEVTLNDESRDLLVQQFKGIPFFLMAMLQAARAGQLDLNSYLACERVYVEELMGGQLARYFSAVLEHIASEPETRAAVVRLLCEAARSGASSASFESWRKRLKLESLAVERLLRALHAQELVNWDGQGIDTRSGSKIWQDYLKIRFRLDSLREPRALVIAEVMADALKRAPQTIARHYRRAASLPLRELLGNFNSQAVQRSLFDPAGFAALYRGATPEEVAGGLAADTDLLRLPQVFHTASAVSFDSALGQFGAESSVVAHAFDGGSYTDENEVVWLVAKVESKLEADREVTELWLKRLDNLARQSGFTRIQPWLIAKEGFSADASDLLRERGAYGSSQQQFALLANRFNESGGPLQAFAEENEVELVLPMGADNELLAATTVEQVARRLSFTAEAINQIKTAVVEACINASEHSLSPDRKIYQRFRVENDKLVITISSRGVVPTNLNGQQPLQPAKGQLDDAADQRRGWGLKLIKTLMDEVEFERVDEGTRLRMIKYLRTSSE